MCPSLATKEACQDAGIEAERLRVVPLGVRVPPQQANAATAFAGDTASSVPSSCSSAPSSRGRTCIA